MKSSTTLDKIVGSLLKAQAAMGSAFKGSNNPFFKSKYADYSAVLDACKKPLNDNGITILQPMNCEQNIISVETVLIHESGEWISSTTPVVVAKQGDPQALGSAITYARRYGLQSLVSLPADDDDGEAAMGREQSLAKTTQPMKPAEQKQVTPKQPTPPIAKAPTSREMLLENVKNTSALVFAKKKKTPTEVLTYMKDTFNVESKEACSNEQLEALITYLKTLLQ